MGGSAGAVGIGCIVVRCEGFFPDVQNRNIRHETQIGSEYKVTPDGGMVSIMQNVNGGSGMKSKSNKIKLIASSLWMWLRVRICRDCKVLGGTSRGLTTPLKTAFRINFSHISRLWEGVFIIIRLILVYV